MTPLVLAAVAVAGQVAYPLTHGVVRQELSAVVVLVFALAVLTSAGWSNAWRLLVFAGLGSLAMEICGVHTGQPFGTYAYTGHLGPRLGGVPVVVPLAWTMLSWPALCVGRRLASGYAARVAIGGAALATWDLLLDPQMVAAGNWRWSAAGPALGGIPLHNDLGWLVCAVALMAVLEKVCAPARDDRLPIAAWLWTWLGSVLAELVFLGLPLAALAGGLGMAVVGLPLLTTGNRPAPR